MQKKINYEIFGCIHLGGKAFVDAEHES